MGNSYSEPIPKHEDLGLVAMVFKGPDKVRLIHSPIEFSRKVFKILKDFVGEEVESQQNFGVVQVILNFFLIKTVIHNQHSNILTHSHSLSFPQRRSPALTC